MVAAAEERSVGYQTQDLVCPKTLDVQRRRMAVLSPGARGWVLREDAPAFGSDMGVLKHVAEEFGFELLGETVERLGELGMDAGSVAAGLQMS